MRFLIVIEETKTGYSAYVPDLLGCASVGQTRDEIEGNIEQAILFHIEGMKEDGLKIPKPKTEGLSMLIPATA